MTGSRAVPGSFDDFFMNLGGMVRRTFGISRLRCSSDILYIRL